jgi:hypothetical protein
MATAVVSSQISTDSSADLVSQLSGDIDPAGTSINGLGCTKETMCLQDELATQLGFVIHQQCLNTQFSQFAAADKPAGPPPMIKTGNFHIICVLIC